MTPKAEAYYTKYNGEWRFGATLDKPPPRRLGLLRAVFPRRHEGGLVFILVLELS